MKTSHQLYKEFKCYLHEITAASSTPFARMSGRNGWSQNRLSLAAIEIFGLDDLVDGFTSANQVEGDQIVGAVAIDLTAGKSADSDVCAAITRDRVLKKKDMYNVSFCTVMAFLKRQDFTSKTVREAPWPSLGAEMSTAGPSWRTPLRSSWSWPAMLFFKLTIHSGSLASILTPLI